MRCDPTDGSVAAHPPILATNAPQQANRRSPEENTMCAGRGFRQQSLHRLGRADDNTSKDTQVHPRMEPNGKIDPSATTRAARKHTRHGASQHHACSCSAPTSPRVRGAASKRKIVKHILLVDDERPILDGLRWRFHSMQRQWHIDCAGSGQEAIDRMDRQHYDVIVTDMRMPHMNGAQLLEVVRARWPHTIRIVLSGYNDPGDTALIVSLAHQYLSKPCEPKLLESVIHRCLLLHDLLHGSRVPALVGRISKLPAVPRIYSRLQAMVKDDAITVSEVARLISTDSAISAQILHIVNSAFFRLARRVTNIGQAVSYLGFTAIRNIAMSVEIFSQWSATSAGPVEPEKLQSHAQMVAAAVGSLTAKTPIADDAMLAGLLHDIGYWVLAQECPTELQAAVELAQASRIQLHEAETRTFGVSHAEMGAYLLGLWGLPYPVIEAVAHHHLPQRVPSSDFDVLAALAVAHSLTPGDSATFNADLPADSRIDESYFVSVNAPIDWTEAQRRVTVTLQSFEASS
jgi:HD-like signal output (HDOD) protein